jgi:hypothetical protein
LESQKIGRLCSIAIRANVCRSEWNVRFSPVGPTRGSPARFITGYSTRRRTT